MSKNGAPPLVVVELGTGWMVPSPVRPSQRLQALLPRFKQFDIGQPRLVIRRLQARWGSCHSNGTITLNLQLMQVPKHYIDYVIVHELCHLVEHNHSKRFYLLLDRVMPDWRERRRRLNELQLG